MRLSHLLLGGAIVAAPIAIGATPALAEEFSCTGSIGAVSLDNVRVPDGATCRLTGTTLNGSIVVGSGATLFANAVSVNGNVQAENHRFVRLAGSFVGGAVQIKQGGGATVVDTTTPSDLQFDANSGYLTIRRNDVNGSIQVVSNSGGADIRANTVDGNLQCKENAPAPTGGGNVVQGVKEDQCAAL